MGVVVVNAPQSDEDFGIPVMNEGIPTIAMFARDWDLLNELLPSTMSMINYLARRQHDVPTCPMGAELDVFALLLEYEHTGRPINIPAGGLAKDYLERLRCEHPYWFLGGDPATRSPW